MTMELTMRAPVPAGMIETAAGRIVADDGYGRLLAALDEAHEVTDHVGVTLLGEQGGTWAFFTGDHLERDGTLHVGGEDPLIVNTDSTLAGARFGEIRWCGGHTMADGARTVRFNVAGAAMTLTWKGPRPDGKGDE